MRIRFILIVPLLTSMVLATTQQQPAQADSTGACPVSFITMRLTGITADQKQRQYLVVVRTDLKGSTRLVVAPMDVHLGVMPKITTDVFDPSGKIVTLTLWSRQPLEGLKLLSVMRPGSDDFPCVGQILIEDVAHVTPTITVFAHDRDLPAGVSLSTSLFAAGDFIERARLNYPEVAKEQGISGTVVVIVTVTGNGPPERVRLYRSSDSSLLDRAALFSARTSTFSAATEDGVPTSRDYLIDYVFRIEGGPTQETRCGVSIGSVHLKPVPAIPHAELFNVNIASADHNVTAATLGLFADQSRSGIPVTLPEIAFNTEQDSAAHGMETVNKGARFLWIGPSVNYVNLQSVVGLDGGSRQCSGDAIHALDDDGNPVETLPALPDQAPPSAWLVLPARYAARVFPAYPRDEADAGHGGCAHVMVHLGTDAAVDNVWVIDSSGHGPLDSAAMDAARASAYELVPEQDTSSTQYYDETYCFHPS